MLFLELIHLAQTQTAPTYVTGGREVELELSAGTPVSDAPDGHFGSRVASTNSCHYLAPALLVLDVGHATPSNNRDIRELCSAEVSLR